jgi:hypothetical protein
MSDLEMTTTSRKMVEDTLEVLRSHANATNDAIYRLYGLLSANPDGRTVGPAPEMGDGDEIRHGETTVAPAI